MKLNNLLAALLCFVISISVGYAQFDERYLFPINPGQKNFLAGTMGELRSSHFHAGIDIKTGGVEGLPVYATKRGYITRIKISTSGYGNALYMLHPDGNTSVYAHLKTFDKPIQDWVRKQQYEKETFEIELFPEPYQFAYKRGEVIAKSGNTGGSTGPHLHFEIRDPLQKVLNPLHFGFSEIKDHIAPIAWRVAVQPMEENSRVNGEFKRQDFNLTRIGRNYKIQDTIYISGPVGLEVLGHDKLDGAANKNGISIMNAKANETTFFYQDIDSMSFALQRHIMVHYPYKTKVQTGYRYHKMYVEYGNKMNYYKTAGNNGLIDLSTDSTAKVTIEMYDPYENKSEISLVLKGKTPARKLTNPIDFQIDESHYEIDRNILKIYAKSTCEEPEDAMLHFDDTIVSVPYSYMQQNIAIYLWDLNEGIPNSVLACEAGSNIRLKHEVLPKKNTTIEDDHMRISFSSNDLFDTLYLETSYDKILQGNLETFYVGPETYPLKSYAQFTLKPEKSYSEQDKFHAYAVDDNGNFSFEGGEWNNNEITFSSRSLGTYTIVQDTIPPTIRPVKGTTTYFIIKDDLSGLKEYKVLLNGEWILANYEYKKSLIWLEWPDDIESKSGQLEVIVTDQAGNTTTYSTKR